MLTSEHIDAFRAAIAADEALQALAEVADDHGLAAAVNAKTIGGRVLVPNWRIKQQVIQWGAWGAIVLTASNEAAPLEARVLAINVRDWIDDRTGVIQNTDLDIAAPMLAGLVAATFLTQEQADALGALADTQISLAEQICGAGYSATREDMGACRWEPPA